MTNGMNVMIFCLDGFKCRRNVIEDTNILCPHDTPNMGVTIYISTRNYFAA